MEKPRLLQGFRDYLPSTMRTRLTVINKIRSVYESYGFEPLDTPALEYAELLMGKYGEDEKLIYSFEDNGKRHVALRYDLTVPLARVATSYPDLPKPFKRYQVAPVWRAESPQKGRYREFMQFDADIVGTSSPLADSEILVMMGDMMSALGLHDYKIRLNHRGLLNALLKHFTVKQADIPFVLRLIDKLEKIGRTEVEKGLVEKLDQQTTGELLNVLELRDEAIFDRLHHILQDDAEGLEVLHQFQDIVELAGGVTERRVVDLTIVRGLDYYTGIIYETSLTSHPSIGTICAGGRYDSLMSKLAGVDTPAVGTSLGVDRLMAVYEEIHATRAPQKVCVAMFPGFEKETFGLARDLRASGIPTVIAYGNAKLGKQLQYADQIGASSVLLYGENEIQRGIVIVRNMQNGEQLEVQKHHITEHFHQEMNK